VPERHKGAACLRIRMIATSNVKGVINGDRDKYQVSNGRHHFQWEGTENRLAPKIIHHNMRVAPET
jgi:hypothetical protein